MKPRIAAVVLILVMLALACNRPTAPAATPDVMRSASPEFLTQAAQTIQAVGQVSHTPTVQLVTATATPPPPGTPTNTSPPATATAQPCDQAQFIADVTIPDGTKMAPGQAFTKTWRLRNVGTCTWTSAYALVFSGSESMGAPAAVTLPGDVPPNSTVDLSIDMKAPATPGTYTGLWRLRNAAGVNFGVFDNQPFFVAIEVVANTPTASVTPTVTVTRPVTLTPPATGVIYNFTDNVCKAEWRTASGVLACPGTSNDTQGYVMRLENPRLETGALEDDPVLLTVPQAVTDGVITGRFPAMQVQTGQHFQATLGCASSMTDCNVIYQVNFSIGGGEPSNLGQWTQTHDGSIQGVDVDLSPLNGQTIQIILVVLANGVPDQDQALWVYPRIVKQ